MIHIRVKILFFLILLLFFSACTYNYEKEIIENNKNHLNIIINAKSLIVNKVSLKNINNSNDDIRIGKAAFFAPASPIAKVAVGMPYGICTNCVLS